MPMACLLDNGRLSVPVKYVCISGRVNLKKLKILVGSAICFENS